MTKNWFRDSHKKSGGKALSAPAASLAGLKKNKDTEADRRVLVMAGGALAGIAILLILAGSGAAFDFIALIGTMLLLCALLLFDILSRRRWERRIADQLRKLSDHHDRLVREVARNRNDVAGLKEGLARAAHTVEEQGKRYSPATSIEARMIETIIEQLGALGEKPRAEIQTGPGSQVLELEMAPPPLKAPPLSALDREITPDFDEFSDAVVLELVRHAVRHDTIDIFMQPIVSLPQRKARMFEIYGRIRAQGGSHMPARRFLALAEKEQLVPAIDNLLLLRCLQLLRERADENPYILNISSTTLHDRGFMGDLVAFLSQSRNLAGNLIFELSQVDVEGLDPSLVQILDGLSRLGCRFSMDRIRQRKIDINMLKNRHIRFIKLDAAWIIKESQSKTGFSRIVQFKKQLDAAGIDLIVERIENDGLLRELLDHSIDFGQGYLFGKPDTAAAWQSRKAT